MYEWEIKDKIDSGIIIEDDIEEYVHLAEDRVIDIMETIGLEDCEPFNFYRLTDGLYYVVWKNRGTFANIIRKHKTELVEYENFGMSYNYIWFGFTYKQLEDGIVESRGEVETILDRIQKLLNLSDSPNINEAKLAAVKAQELMAKYDIKELEKADKGIVISDYYNDFNMSWFVPLARAIAPNYKCKLVIQSDRSLVSVYGMKTDVIIFKKMMAYLSDRCDKTSYIYEKNRKKAGYEYKGCYTEFSKGFIDGIQLELDKQCVALTITIPVEVETEYAIKTKGLKSYHDLTKEPLYGDEYYDGVKEGTKTMKSRQLE